MMMGEPGRISGQEIRRDVNTEGYYGRPGSAGAAGPGAVVSALVLGRNNSAKVVAADL